MKILSITLGLLTALLIPIACQAKIAVLLSRTADPYVAALQGLKSVIGEDVTVYNMESDMSKGQSIIKNLSPQEFKLVVTVGLEASLANQAAETPITSIYTMLMDPLVNQGKQAAGIVLKIEVKDQIVQLQRIFPKRKRIGIIYNPQYSGKDVERIRSSADQSGLSVVGIAIEKATDLDQALQKITSDNTDIIWMPVDKTYLDPAAVQKIIQYALQQNLPLIGFSIFHAKAGATVAFSVDFTDIGRQTGELARQMLKNASESRVEPPQRIIIYVNARTQKKIGRSQFLARQNFSFHIPPCSNCST